MIALSEIYWKQFSDLAIVQQASNGWNLQTMFQTFEPNVEQIARFNLEPRQFLIRLLYYNRVLLNKIAMRFLKINLMSTKQFAVKMPFKFLKTSNTPSTLFGRSLEPGACTNFHTGIALDVVFARLWLR